MSHVLVLGGAGFVGSRIATTFVAAGHSVCVVDGLLARTSGRRENLPVAGSRLEFVHSRVEELVDLEGRIAASDVVIDAMGWTLHRGALEDPLYDMALNLGSHVSWLRRIPSGASPLVISLGARAQYGDVEGPVITQDAPQEPLDVQGIHKAAAERHFRLAAKLREVPVVVLRFPACIGSNQPVAGDDIGLVGGFIRDALANRPIKVFGRGRRRAIAFVGDVAEVVLRLARIPGRGFAAYNLRGEDLAIASLAERVVGIVGRGSVEVAEVPPELAAIDSGAALLDESGLSLALAGDVPHTPLGEALEETVRYMKEVIG